MGCPGLGRVSPRTQNRCVWACPTQGRRGLSEPGLLARARALTRTLRPRLPPPPPQDRRGGLSEAPVPAVPCSPGTCRPVAERWLHSPTGEVLALFPSLPLDRVRVHPSPGSSGGLVLLGQQMDSGAVREGKAGPPALSVLGPAPAQHLSRAAAPCRERGSEPPTAHCPYPATPRWAWQPWARPWWALPCCPQPCSPSLGQGRQAALWPGVCSSLGTFPRGPPCWGPRSWWLPVGTTCMPLLPEPQGSWGADVPGSRPLSWVRPVPHQLRDPSLVIAGRSRPSSPWPLRAPAPCPCPLLPTGGLTRGVGS